VKLANEMIDRLRAECQEYELTIVEQDREMAQLRELLNYKKNEKQDLRMCRKENEQLNH
jgi:hypothetical protein